MILYQMSYYHWVMLAVGVVAGTAAAVYYLKKKKKADSSFSIPTVDELIARQKVCNEMTLATAVNWVQEQQEKFKGTELLYIIGKINEKNVNMFTTDRSVLTKLDTDKYLFLLAVEKERKLSLAVQLINFGSVEQDLEKMLQEDGYCVIEDK